MALARGMKVEWAERGVTVACVVVTWQRAELGADDGAGDSRNEG